MSDTVISVENLSKSYLIRHQAAAGSAERYTALRTYMHHQLLRDTDVMSMAHSLEVRVPLVDVALVEGVLRLPTADKTSHAASPKPLLLQAMQGQLPELIRQRGDKWGFTLPFAPWLRAGRLQAQGHDLLATVHQNGWLRSAKIDMIERAYQGNEVHWSRLWALLALGTIQATGKQNRDGIIYSHDTRSTVNG